MSKTFMLKILTPEKVVVSEEAEKVFTKTPVGEVEFLYNHEPMVLSTVPFVTKFIDASGNKKELFTSKGIVTVEQENVTLLVDAAEFKEDIDLERAKRAKERALKELNEGSFENKEILELSLERANVRINFVENMQK